MEKWRIEEYIMVKKRKKSTKRHSRKQLVVAKDNIRNAAYNDIAILCSAMIDVFSEIKLAAERGDKAAVLAGRDRGTELTKTMSIDPFIAIEDLPDVYDQQ